MKISAIIPAYNEATRIGLTLQQVVPFVDEIIVIDDASSDETAAVARQHGAKVLVHAKNQGYIAAIKAGFQAASGDIVVTLDADGEFPVDVIPELIRPILANQADMVQGHRDIIPRPSERFLTWLAQRKAKVGDTGTGLRAIRTPLARSLAINGACICGILSLEVVATGGRIVEVPIKLQTVDKPRNYAWFHGRQLLYLLPWLFRHYR
jgi:glycosyltransferase involved in cell wall biosynthesis